MNNFDLKKFLIENKLTSNSKALNEQEGMPPRIPTDFNNLSSDLEKIGIDINRPILASEDNMFDFPKRPKKTTVPKLIEYIKSPYEGPKYDNFKFSLIADEETLRSYDDFFREEHLRGTEMKVIIYISSEASYIIFQ